VTETLEDSNGKYGRTVIKESFIVASRGLQILKGIGHSNFILCIPLPVILANSNGMTGSVVKFPLASHSPEDLHAGRLDWHTNAAIEDKAIIAPRFVQITNNPR
jgi:hypothetical protein